MKTERLFSVSILAGRNAPLVFHPELGYKKIDGELLRCQRNNKSTLILPKRFAPRVIHNQRLALYAKLLQLISPPSPEMLQLPHALRGILVENASRAS